MRDGCSLGNGPRLSCEAPPPWKLLSREISLNSRAFLQIPATYAQENPVSCDRCQEALFVLLGCLAIPCKCLWKWLFLSHI
jgi:hypothetical protein